MSIFSNSANSVCATTFSERYNERVIDDRRIGHYIRTLFSYNMVRSISDPLEHLVNQVEILRHQPSYLANWIFCKQTNSLKNEKYVTKRKYLEEKLWKKITLKKNKTDIIKISVMSRARTRNITHVEQRRRPLHYRNQLKIHRSKNVFKVARRK